MSQDVAPDEIVVLVDGDACPVKDEVFRVAGRHGIRTVVVANSYMMLPKDPLIERVVVGSRLDEADDWIAARAHARTVVVTNDVPLAARCVAAGAAVLAPDGRPFTAASVGLALATRNLLADLREAGAVTGGPRPFSRHDRSAFLQALDAAIRRLKRTAGGAGARSASP